MLFFEKAVQLKSNGPPLWLTGRGAVPLNTSSRVRLPRHVSCFSNQGENNTVHRENKFVRTKFQRTLKKKARGLNNFVDLDYGTFIA